MTHNVEQPWLIDARDLKKHYSVTKRLWGKTANVKALDGITFTLARGKTLAVVGESGCGKSTLGRLLTMIETPTAGELYWNGQNLLEADRQAEALRQKKFRSFFRILTRHSIHVRRLAKFWKNL